MKTKHCEKRWLKNSEKGMGHHQGRDAKGGLRSDGTKTSNSIREQAGLRRTVFGNKLD